MIDPDIVELRKTVLGSFVTAVRGSLDNIEAKPDDLDAAKAEVAQVYKASQMLLLALGMEKDLHD